MLGYKCGDSTENEPDLSLFHCCPSAREEQMFGLSGMFEQMEENPVRQSSSHEGGPP